MSSPHNNIQLAKLFAFLRGENPALNNSDLSFQILEANRQKNVITPPSHIREKLRQQISLQSSQESNRSPGRQWLHFSSISTRVAFATAMLALAVTSAILLTPKTETLQLTTQAQSGWITLSERQTLVDQGLELNASQKSALFLQQGKKNHLFIKAGTVRANIDHHRITKEAWFHTLHGSIITEGTSFTIHTSDEATRIVLHEGKIGVYNDLDGAMKKTTHSAPADFILTQRAFAGNGNPNFMQFENRIDQQRKQTDQHKGQSPSPLAKTPEATQRKVTLILKNGDHVSGVIEKSGAAHIYLRTPRGLLTIPKSEINKEL